MPAVTIAVRSGDLHTASVRAFGLKRDAAAALAALRNAGTSREPCVSIHPAHTRLSRFYVIGRPDPLAEMTWIMRGDGLWAVGRMYDDTGTGAPWTPTGAAPVPATFTHVVRTVNVANRHERYRTKSNGSCGRWVTSDDAVAVCTCGRKFWGSTRAEARAKGRYHVDHPGGEPTGA